MSERFNRRECLRKGTTGLLAGAALGAGVLNLAAAENGKAMSQFQPPSPPAPLPKGEGSSNEESLKPVRLGVVGLGPRGTFLLQHLISQYPGVTVPALCDLNPNRLRGGIEIVKKVKGTTPVGYCKGEFEYRNMFQRDDLDGIVVATGVQVFGRISIDAMKAGKHVGSEVSGPHTMDDCWGIVEEKERSGKHYMLLEQCCYGDVNLMILGMIKRGMFGEPYYAECSYVHDCKVDGGGKSRYVEADQTLSWRGRMLAEGHGNSYPGHGIASTAKWLGINDGDRFEYCNAMMSDPREVHQQVVEQFGPDSKAAKIQFQTGDFLSTFIHTVNGKMIRIDYSPSSTRPKSLYYLAQGTNGCYDTRYGIYVRSGPRSAYPQWSSTDEFLKKHRHPWWSKEGEAALKSGGHAGMEYFCYRDFIDMIRYDREPWVDCYDSAAYGAITHCSQLSIDRKGGPVEIPDFTKGKWKDPDWRKDRPSPASAIST